MGIASRIRHGPCLIFRKYTEYWGEGSEQEITVQCDEFEDYGKHKVP